MKAQRAGLVALAVGLVAGLAAAALAWPAAARAEYRAYELEITDVLDCKLNKREKCRTGKIVTSMSPDLYVQTNGGEDRIGVLMVATWMCYGDTSGYKEVCTRPPARSPKFAVGDDVRITLKKHITDSWRGKVEVAYYQDDLRANVYGVRFPERQNVYLRYFEKDLEKTAPAAAPASPAAGPPGVPSAPAAPAESPAAGAAASAAPSPAVAPAGAPGAGATPSAAVPGGVSAAPAATPAATPGLPVPAGVAPAAPAAAPAAGPAAAPARPPAPAPAAPAPPAAAPAPAPSAAAPAAPAAAPPAPAPRAEPPR